MNGVFTVVSTFFVISWRWVKNCEADIRTIMTAVTMCTLVVDEPSASILSALSVNFAASGAPTMCAFCALARSASSMNPMVLFDAMLLSTW
ncbi:hypothetical protein EES44_00850 [Streptomyces sp. ADI96-15]|nr:hypothetical protein EES44_00850 [Streptomyces sp. ADI96-15]